MEYARFVALRQETCEAFARDLGKARRGDKLSFVELEDLSVRYRQLLHDHALARSRYPGTAMERQLKGLVLEGTLWLQRDTGEHLPSVGSFLTSVFPEAMGRLRPALAVTTSLFLLAACLGAALTAVEPSLGQTFVGQEAISGLKKGELWTESIFAVTPGAVASASIASNNISVAITGWAGGMAAGLGALYVVFMNGLMLGSVLAVTASYSMGGALFEFIAAHGPLEITLILVTTAAGLDVGRALVEAGDQPRAVRLRESGRRALVVLLGCLPFLLMLGFVESFLSPSRSIGVPVQVTLGVLLEASFLLLAFSPRREPEAP